ncbi:Variant surface glycoprotein [Trypanosoma congolense IL3000]|uniref:Variant surface glycoprotein n=1 Tax=Trypanosoma congolense (strain IL3000) TaxID=1068625 RepID=F9WAR4_TRYCI|nr:Variant surface glycoprotein [Trypanosoma congolense IL3000]
METKMKTIMVIVKTMNVLMVMGIVFIGVHGAQEIAGEQKKEDFELLCNIMKAVSGAWQTVNEPEVYSDDDIKKLDEMVGRSLFGSKWIEGRVGIWDLPDEFTEKDRKRSEVCGSESKNNGMPAASDSMASAFLCLCMPVNVDEKDLCGLHVSVKEKWSEHVSQNVEVFKTVWSDGFSNGVMHRCEASHDSFGNIEEARKNLTVSLEALKSSLKKRGSGVLGENIGRCDESHACAYVKESPTWLQKLEEIEKLTLKPLPSDPLPPPPPLEPPSSPIPISEPAAISPEKPTPPPITSKIIEENTEQEQLKASEERQKTKLKPKPKPEINPIETHQKQEEESQVKDNETSSSNINSPKWHLLAFFLI